MNSEILCNAKEAAQILNCDRATIVRNAQAGNLPVLGKLSGRTGSYVFRRVDIEYALRSGWPNARPQWLKFEA